MLRTRSFLPRLQPAPSASARPSPLDLTAFPSHPAIRVTPVDFERWNGTRVRFAPDDAITDMAQTLTALLVR